MTAKTTWNTFSYNEEVHTLENTGWTPNGK